MIRMDSVSYVLNIGSTNTQIHFWQGWGSEMMYTTFGGFSFLFRLLKQGPAMGDPRM